MRANGKSRDWAQQQFINARRNGYPAWLWPDVPIAHWRWAVAAIEDVARNFLAGESKIVLAGSDAKALGLAAYTSGMGPLLGFWIESGIVSAETQVEDLVALHLSHNRLRMARLCETAGEMLGKLNALDISPLILKGMHTAFAYFPEAGSRPLSDIDMHIPMESMAAAERVLAGLGYQKVLRMRSPYTCDWIPPAQSLAPHTLTFVHKDDPWSIDVVGTLDKQLPAGQWIRFGTLLPCSERADWFAGARARAMQQPLLVLYLAVHISQALLNVTVLRVLELAMVIRRDVEAKKLDWSDFVRGAISIGGLQFAYPAMSFVERLAQGTIPAEVMMAAVRSAPPRLREVVDRLTISMAQPLDRHSVRERFMWASARRETLRQIASELFVDGQGRPLGPSLHRIGSKLWALGRGRYSP